MQILRNRNIRFALATVAAMSVAACDDDPIEPHDHAEAGGVVVLDGNGDVLTTSVGANVAFDAPLVLQAGTEVDVEILFLDADDPDNLDLAFHPHADEGHSLRVTIEDESIAAYHGHDDHGHLEGLAVGETTAVIELQHGSHADFSSGPLTIVVE